MVVKTTFLVLKQRQVLQVVDVVLDVGVPHVLELQEGGPRGETSKEVEQGHTLRIALFEDLDAHFGTHTQRAVVLIDSRGGFLLVKTHVAFNVFSNYLLLRLDAMIDLNQTVFVLFVDDGVYVNGSDKHDGVRIAVQVLDHVVLGECLRKDSLIVQQSQNLIPLSRCKHL